MGAGGSYFDDEPVKPKTLPVITPKNRVQTLLERMRGGVSSQESSGNAAAVNPHSGALGEFQVMPKNVPVWTRQYLGRAMTPEEFRRDPNAQRVVFDGEMGKYLNKALQDAPDDDTAIRMAAAAWYGGEGAMRRYDDTKPQMYKGNRYPSFREYTTGIINKIRGGAASPTARYRFAPTQIVDYSGTQVDLTPDTYFDGDSQPVPASQAGSYFDDEPVTQTPQPVAITPTSPQNDQNALLEAYRKSGAKVPFNEFVAAQQGASPTTPQPVVAPVIPQTPRIAAGQLTPEESADLALVQSRDARQVGVTQYGGRPATDREQEGLARFRAYIDAMGITKPTQADLDAFNAIERADRERATQMQVEAIAQSRPLTAQPRPVRQAMQKTAPVPQTTVAPQTPGQTQPETFTDTIANLRYKAKDEADFQNFTRKETERVLLDKVKGATGADVDAALGDSKFSSRFFSPDKEAARITVPATLQRAVAAARDARIEFEAKKRRVKERAESGEDPLDAMLQEQLITPEAYVTAKYEREQEAEREAEARKVLEKQLEEDSFSPSRGKNAFSDAQAYVPAKGTRNVDQFLKEQGMTATEFLEQQRIEAKERVEMWKAIAANPNSAAAEFGNSLLKTVPKAVSGLLKTLSIGSEALEFAIEGYGPSGKQVLDWIGRDEREAKDRGFYQMGKWLDRTTEELLPGDPRFKKSFILNTLPDTIGQLLLQIGAGVATGGVTVPLLLGGALGASEAYEDADKFKGTRGQKILAALVGGIASVPDAIPLTKWLKPLGAAERTGFIGKLVNSIFGKSAAEIGEQESLTFARQFLKNAWKSGAFEGLQEVSENKINDALAAMTFDPKRKVFVINGRDLESFLAGFIGGTVGAGIETTAEMAGIDRTAESKPLQLTPEVIQKELDDAQNGVEKAKYEPIAPQPDKVVEKVAKKAAQKLVEVAPKPVTEEVKAELVADVTATKPVATTPENTPTEVTPIAPQKADSPEVAARKEKARSVLIRGKKEDVKGDVAESATTDNSKDLTAGLEAIRTQAQEDIDAPFTNREKRQVDLLTKQLEQTTVRKQFEQRRTELAKEIADLEALPAEKQRSGILVQQKRAERIINEAFQNYETRQNERTAKRGVKIATQNAAASVADRAISALSNIADNIPAFDDVARQNLAKEIKDVLSYDKTRFDGPVNEKALAEMAFRALPPDVQKQIKMRPVKETPKSEQVAPDVVTKADVVDAANADLDTTFFDADKMIAGKQKQILNKKFLVNGKVRTRAQAIEDAIANGAVIKTSPRYNDYERSELEKERDGLRRFHEKYPRSKQGRRFEEIEKLLEKNVNEPREELVMPDGTILMFVSGRVPIRYAKHLLANPRPTKTTATPSSNVNTKPFREMFGTAEMALVMPRQAFVEQRIAQNKNNPNLSGKAADGTPMVDVFRESYADTHKAFVETALKEGKPVPAEVLADYPELAAKQTPTPKTPAQPTKDGQAGKVEKEPWEMTAKEWESARENAKPNTAQSRPSKNDASTAARRMSDVERLTYDVRKADQAAIKEYAAAIKQGRKPSISDAEARDIIDRINTPVFHRDVIEKALKDGKPVPAEVLADYPDLAERYAAKPSDAKPAKSPARVKRERETAQIKTKENPTKDAKTPLSESKSPVGETVLVSDKDSEGAGGKWQVNANEEQQAKLDSLITKSTAQGREVVSVNRNKDGLIHLVVTKDKKRNTVTEFTIFKDGQSALGLSGNLDYTAEKKIEGKQTVPGKRLEKVENAKTEGVRKDERETGAPQNADVTPLDEAEMRKLKNDIRDVVGLTTEKGEKITVKASAAMPDLDRAVTTFEKALEHGNEFKLHFDRAQRYLDAFKAERDKRIAKANAPAVGERAEQFVAKYGVTTTALVSQMNDLPKASRSIDALARAYELLTKKELADDKRTELTKDLIEAHRGLRPKYGLDYTGEVTLDPLPARPLKLRGGAALKNILTREKSRFTMDVILSSEGRFIATDGHQLTIIRHPDAKKTVDAANLYDINADGTISKSSRGGAFPNWKIVVPDVYERVSQPVPIQPLIDQANALVAASKYVNAYAANLRMDVGLDTGVFANAHYVLDGLQALQANGAKTVTLKLHSDETAQIVFESDNGDLHLVMPPRLDDANIGNHNGIYSTIDIPTKETGDKQPETPLRRLPDTDFDTEAYQKERDAIPLVKDKDGNLLAPNGKKSNLNEKLWRTVRTPTFLKWFGDWINDPQNASKVVDENGEPLVAFSGHNNLELYGDKYIKKAGTAGGFYATESPEVASGYATGKIGSRETFENGNQYRFKQKNGEWKKKLSQLEFTPEHQQIAKEYIQGLGYDVEKYWRDNSRYDADARRAIYSGGLRNPINVFNFLEYMGENIVYPSREENATWEEKNPYSAFEEILNKAGIDWRAQDWAQPGIFQLFLNIRNPLDATEPVPQNLLKALERKASRARESMSQDGLWNSSWTKEFPMREWVQMMRDGDESWATQIPAKAWPILEDFGYDGIKELGNKGATDRKQRQINWIALEPTQIKSIFNRGSFDDATGNMLRKIADDADEPFYSNLERVIEAKMPNRAGAEQVKAIVNNPQSGIKAEEVEWLGLNEWLDDQKGAVTKADVLEFVRANKVEVREVEKSLNSKKRSWSMLANRADYLGDQAISVQQDSTGWYVWDEDTRTRVGDRFATQAEAIAHAEAKLNLADVSFDDTQFSQFQLEGEKTDYRELLLTLPQRQTEFDRVKIVPDGKNWRVAEYAVNGEFNGYVTPPMLSYDEASIQRERFLREDFGLKASSQEVYRSHHFREPNILAHLRLNERTINGKRTLFLEEVQSDWHQAGRKQGYMRSFNPKNLIVEPIVATQNVIDEATLFEEGKPISFKLGDNIYRAKYGNEIGWSYGATEAEAKAETKRIFDQFLSKRNSTVPDAPFKKSWHELAMKRALRYAAENGFDAVAWTTGEQQIERYDLSKQLDSIQATKNDDGTFDLEGFKGASTLFEKTNVPANELEANVGKDLAEKIVAESGEWIPLRGAYEYSGADLKVGGEGMKGFYDGILPKFVNKYTKKWGGKVETALLNTSARQPKYAFRINRTNETISRGRVGDFNTKEDAIAAASVNYSAQQNGYEIIDLNAEKPRTGSIHFLEITPAMRESVMQGQPLFKIADKQTPADTRRQKQLNAADNILETLADVETRVDGDQVKLSLEAAEFIRAASSVIDNANLADTPNIAGQFLSPDDVANFVEVLNDFADVAADDGFDNAPLKDLVKAIETAAEVNGTVVLNVFDDAVRHEKAHQLGYLNAKDENKTLMRRIANIRGFVKANEAVIQKAYDKLFRPAGYDLSKSTAAIVEEIAVYITDGDHRRLGLTADEAAGYMLNWLRAYEQANGEGSLDNFREFYKGLGIAERAIEEHYEKQQREADSRGLQEEQRQNGEGAARGDGAASGQDSRRKGKERNADEAAENEAGQVEDRRLSGDGRLKESQTPKSLKEKAGIDIGTRLYDGVTNAEQQLFADRQLDKGVDQARQWFESAVADGNLNNGSTGVVGLSLMNHYAKQGDIKALNEIGDKLVPMIAEAAQSVQAMRIINLYDPEKAAAYAAKIKKQRTGKDLTPEEAKRAEQVAQNLADAVSTDALTDEAIKQNNAELEALKKDKAEIEELAKALTSDKTKLQLKLDAIAKKMRNLRAQLKRVQDAKPRTPRTPVAKLKETLEKQKGDLERVLAEAFGGAGLRKIGEQSDFDTETYQKERDAIPLVKDKDGNLLAPNGKKSNLNEKLWRTVRTPTFLKWFGDWVNGPENASKVVDENGEPLVVYHGTADDIAVFNNFVKWFALKPRLAEDYAQMRDEYGQRGGQSSANVIPAFIRSLRPFDADKLSKGANSINEFVSELLNQTSDAGRPVDIDRVSGLTQVLRDGRLQEESGPYFSPWNFWMDPETYFGRKGADAIKSIFKQLGFDSITFTEEGLATVGVLDSSQIKSIFNRGSFDAESNEILRAIAPEVLTEEQEDALVKLTALDIINGKSYADVIKGIEKRVGTMLSDDQVRQVHAMSAKMLRKDKGLDLDELFDAERLRKNKEAKNRADNMRKAAKILDADEKAALKEWNEATRANGIGKVADFILRLGVDGDYSDATIFAALARKTIAPGALIERLGKLYPEMSRDDIRRTLREADALYKDGLKEAERMRNLIADREIQTEEANKQLSDAKRANRGAKSRAMRDANNFYDSLTKSKGEAVAESIVNYRKANLLSGVQTHLKNLLGNLTFGISNEAIRGIAVAADMLAARRTNMRTVQGVSLQGMKDGFNALFKADPALKNLDMESGLRTAKSILQYGDSIDGLNKLQLSESHLADKFDNKVAKKLLPIADAYINYSFRALQAEDALFRVYAFRRSIEEQAKLAEKNGEGDYATLIENPTHVMQLLASEFADEQTFQNSNAISDIIADIKRTVANKFRGGYLFKAAVEIVMPFDRTPTNIILRVIEHTPVGFGLAAKSVYDLKTKPKAAVEKFNAQYRGAVEQDLMTQAEFEALSPAKQREKIAEQIQKLYTKKYQREFATLIGRASAGSSLMALGAFLASIGVLAGAMDWDDKEERPEAAQRAKEGVDTGSIDLPGFGFRFRLPDTPAAKVMIAGATAYEQAKMVETKKKDALEAVLSGVGESFSGIAMEQPLARSTKDLLFNERLTVGGFTGNLASSFVPASSFVRGLSEISDDEARRKSGVRANEDAGLSYLDKQRINFQRQFFGGIPFVRRLNPVSDTTVPKTERGGVLRRTVRALEPFDITTSGLGARERREFERKKRQRELENQKREKKELREIERKGLYR